MLGPVTGPLVGFAVLALYTLTCWWIWTRKMSPIVQHTLAAVSAATTYTVIFVLSEIVIIAVALTIGYGYLGNLAAQKTMANRVVSDS